MGSVDKETGRGGNKGEGGLLLPVVGDEGEVLDVDEAVVVEVASGGGVTGVLPVVGDEGLVLDVDDAVVVGVAEGAARDV